MPNGAEMWGIFQHLDHNGNQTGGGYVVRGRRNGGYDYPYNKWTPVHECKALSQAEKRADALNGLLDPS